MKFRADCRWKPARFFLRWCLRLSWITGFKKKSGKLIASIYSLIPFDHLGHFTFLSPFISLAVSRKLVLIISPCWFLPDLDGVARQVRLSLAAMLLGKSWLGGRCVGHWDSTDWFAANHQRHQWKQSVLGMSQHFLSWHLAYVKRGAIFVAWPAPE